MKHSTRLAVLLILLLLSAAARAQDGAPAAADVLAALPPATSLSTPGGVHYVVLQPGTGPLARAGSRVVVHYQGYLPNGQVFDTSTGHSPLRFRAGRREVIRGWDELLPLLAAGAKVRAWVPAALAYGASGVPSPTEDSRYIIPPNTDLIFDLELVSFK